MWPAEADREAVAAPLRAMLAARPHRERVVAHLGPTNSGKTHAALEILADAPSGSYGGPLRLMAQEVHERLAARLGDGRAGLITGEERINPGADHVACTTELVAPRDVVVVDEVHWLADRDRGSAWTRALLSLPCRELHLVGSADILPALRSAFPELEVRAYDRLAPLHYIGTVPLERVEPGTAVIAFSRKAVLALARDLSVAHPGRVAVLYGAMPLGERKRQAAAFRAGELDVLCATDVLGHGLNLPIRTVLFAETEKWNGTARADLEPWEVAQIAGRAGRFGMHDEGGVGILAGHHWAQPRANVIRAGLRPRPDREGLPTFRRLTTMNLGPAFTDVARAPTEAWPTLLLRWEAIARSLIVDQLATWLRVASVEPMVARLTALGRRTLRDLDPEDAWTFALAPVDTRDEGDLIARLGRAVLGDGTLTDLVDTSWLEVATAAEAESAADRAAVMRWFTRRFPDTGGITAADADRLETLATEAAGRALAEEIATNTYGVCQTCGKPAIPGRPQCDACWKAGRAARTGVRAPGAATSTGNQAQRRRASVPAKVRKPPGRQWRGKLR
ncbi:MAG: helicase-related protein [Chloroflexota bacterium]